MPAEEATPTSVFELLKKDHRLVEELFAELANTEAEEQKVELAQRICLELSIHAEAEERAFYPAAREVLGEDGDDLVREALVEHRSLKSLIAEIDGSSPKKDLFEANLKVLEEYVKHHVKEEEEELFPALEEAGLDAEAVGEKVAAAKARLQKRADSEPPRGRGGVVHVPSLTATRAPAKKAGRAKSKSSRAA